MSQSTHDLLTRAALIAALVMALGSLACFAVAGAILRSMW
jgi:hypothetical protein